LKLQKYKIKNNGKFGLTKYGKVMRKINKIGIVKKLKQKIKLRKMRKWTQDQHCKNNACYDCNFNQYGICKNYNFILFNR